MVIPLNMGVIGFYPSEYYYSRSKMGFYLLLKTNTTSLERDLGELLAQLSAHSGPLSETGATMAAIMEITSEATVRGRVFWSQLQGRRSSPAT